MRRYPAYKRITSAVTLLLLGLWAGYVLLWPNSGQAGAGVPIGSAAPDFELKTLEGETIRLSDLKGQPVVINFFATWCPPCRAEMPLLQESYTEFQEQGLVILAVDLDESDVAVSTFREKYGLTFPIVIDKGDRVSRTYEIIPLPTSYFVDRQGVVQGMWTGELRKPQLRALLSKIL